MPWLRMRGRQEREKTRRGPVRDVSQAWRHVAAGLMVVLYSAQVISCYPAVSDSAPQESRDAQVQRSLFSWPRNNIVPTETINGLAVGKTAGSGGVSTDGSSQYSIPLWVPDGRAGIQPDLSLNYSSNGGNGIVGVGWSLSGLSRITRCPKTFARDGEAWHVEFSASDRLCLDGVRLVPYASYSGQEEYRTEVDGFSKIVAYGTDAAGPRYFKVYLRDGRIMTLGDENVARNSTLDGTRANVVSGSDSHGETHKLEFNQYVRFSWAVSRIEDRSGNYLTVDYGKVPVGSASEPEAFRSGYEHFPTEIRYTGALHNSSVPMSRSVKFFYDRRQDARTQWISGFQTMQTRILSRIEMHGPRPNDTLLLRTYHLRYSYHSSTSRALLKEIQECDGANVCLPATTFDWTSGSQEFTPNLVDASYSADPDTQVADINGDGRDDLFFAVRAYNNGQTVTNWYYQLTTDEGTLPRQMLTDPQPLNGDCNLKSRFLADVDGDGRLDLVRLVCDGAGFRLQRFQIQGSVLSEVPENGYEGSTPYPFAAEAHVADLNGDGLGDLIRSGGGGSLLYYRINIQGAFPSNYAHLSNPYGNTQEFGHCQMADVFGRGASSVVCGLRTLPANRTWLFTTNLGISGRIVQAPTAVAVYDSSLLYANFGYRPARPVFVDVNGDGLSDIVSSNGSGTSLSVALNTGNGFMKWRDWPVHGGVQFYPECGVQVLDHDGDGKQDLLQNFHKLSNGTCTNSTASSPQQVIVLQPNADERSFTVRTTSIRRGWLKVGDVNGDGLTDLVGQHVYPDVPGPASAGLHHYVRKGDRPDLLVRIKDGMGMFDEFVYKPISDPSVYQAKTTSPSRELSLVRRGLWVVAERRGGYDSTVVRKLGYRYEDGWFNKQGRGWLGFSVRVVTDAMTGAVQESRYPTTQKMGQSLYPAGSNPVYEVVSTQVDGRKHELTRDITYGHRGETGSGIYSLAWAQVVETTREWRSSVVNDVVTKRRVTTRTEYDEFGGLTLSRVTSEWNHNGTSFAKSAQTVTEIQNSNTPVSWIIGKPTLVKVTSTDEYGASQVRTSRSVWDSNTGLLSSEVMEPDSRTSTDLSLFKGVSYSRNEFGQVTTVQTSDRNGNFRVAAVVYDSFDYTYPVQASNYYGHWSGLSYHRGLGVLCGMVTPQSRAYEWLFDGFGRTRAARQSEDASSFYVWSATDISYGLTAAGGLQVNTVTPAGLEVSVQYDKLGREILRRIHQGVGNGAAVVSEMEYDDLGRPKRTSLPYEEGQTPAYFQFEYDVLGRLLEKRRPDGVVMERHEYRPQTVTSWDAKGNKHQVIRDGLGRVAQSVDFAPDGRPISTQFRYGPFGLLKDVTDAKGNQVSMEYDRLGRRISLNDPDSGLQTTVYNGLGEVQTHRDANGAVTSYTYDYAGRVTQVSRLASPTAPAQIDTFTWDTAENGVGLLAESMSSDGIKLQYGYDALARPNRKTWTIDGQTFEIEQYYDSLSRVAGIGYPQMPDASRLYLDMYYDSLGNLSLVRDMMEGTFGWQANAWTPLGQLRSESFFNGVTTERTYDGLGQLRAINSSLDSQPLQSLLYDYELNGNLSSRTDLIAGTAEGFSYDSLNRLTSWSVLHNAQTALTQYRYDDIGNLTEKLEGQAGGVDALFQYGTTGLRPHAVKSSPLGIYGYDNNGNQISAPGRTISYTPFNLPAHMVSGSNITNFRYDSAHARTVTQRNNGDEIITLGELYERRTVGGERSHVFNVQNGERKVAQIIWKEQGGTIQEKKVLYLHDERLGSTETVTDSSTPGALVGRQKFSPFGEMRNPTDLQSPISTTSSVVNVGFTGHDVEDEFGVIDMKGRLYDPKLGRFLSPDPIVGSPLFGQAYNRYSYVLNHPMNYTDPSGFTPWLSSSWGSSSSSWIGTGVSLAAAALGYLFNGQNSRATAASSGTGQGLTPRGLEPSQSGLFESSFAQGLISAASNTMMLSAGMGAAAFDMLKGVATGLFKTLEDPLYPILGAADAVHEGYQEDGISGAVNSLNPVSHALKSGYQAYESLERGDYFSAGSHSLKSAVSMGSAVTGAAGLARGLSSGMGLATDSSIALGTEFFGPGDVLAKAKGWVKPLPGYHDVLVHGSPHSFWFYNKGSWSKISHRSLATYMHKSGYTGGNVRLLSCSTGACMTGVAQDLANTLGNGVKVMAPTDTLWIHSNGLLTIGPNQFFNTGSWVEFVARPNP